MRREFLGLATLLAVMCFSTGSTAGAGLQWTWGNPTPSGDDFTAVAYGGGIYVAAGQDGVLYSSSDGVHWTSYTGGVGMGGTYTAALFGGGQFLVAGVDANGGSHVTTSSDGVHWTDIPLSLVNDGEIGLAYGNGSYVALSGSSDATSSDAVHWVMHPLGFTQVQKYGVNDMVVAANNVFVSYGSPPGQGATTSSVYYSTDNGVTWAASSQGVCIGEYVASGSAFFCFDIFGSSANQPVFTSPDGKNWTRQTANGLPSGFNPPIVWNGAQFITQDGQTYTSSDGIHWTGSGVVGTGPRLSTAVSTGSGYFAAVSTPLHGSPLSLATSPDFANWTTQTLSTGITDSDWNNITYGAGKYVAVGADDHQGAGILESGDGLIWNSVYASTSTPPLSAVVYGGGSYIAAGYDSVSNAHLWLSSPDGVSWSPMASPPPGLPISDLAYGNGIFVVLIGNGPGTAYDVATSSDGQTWVLHPLPAGMRGLAYNNSRFISISAGSNNTMVPYSSNDGITWTVGAPFPTPGYFTRIRALGNGFGAVGGYTPPCDGEGSACVGAAYVNYPALALSADGVHWTATVLNSPDSFPQGFDDIASDGTHYFLTEGGSFVMSTDGKEWCAVAGYPVAATVDTLMSNGSQLVTAGLGGAAVTSPLAMGAGGSAASCTGATYGLLPIGSTGGASNGYGGGGGGGLDLWSALALFGLVTRRRRDGTQS